MVNSFRAYSMVKRLLGLGFRAQGPWLESNLFLWQNVGCLLAVFMCVMNA